MSETEYGANDEKTWHLLYLFLLPRDTTSFRAETDYLSMYELHSFIHDLLLSGNARTLNKFHADQLFPETTAGVYTYNQTGALGNCSLVAGRYVYARPAI